MAWMAPADETHRERFYAVLHTDKVNSPARAVQASILAEIRAQHGGSR
jgi:hypothetical protein